jgi:hypothetical protein
MKRKKLLWMATAAAMIATAIACEKSGALVPTPSGGGTTAAEAPTLKATAPELVSPIGGAQQKDGALGFTIKASQVASAGSSLTYRVQILNSGNDNVAGEGTGGGLTISVNSALSPNTGYRWRARAELGALYGPWSNIEPFKSADKILGYIRGNEVYDPLIEGVTVGRVGGGPVTFIPGQGVRIDAEESFIEYNVPQTMAAGEISVLVQGLDVNSSTEDPKLRVITAREGNDAINDNPYRLSIDKRGNGAIAWRFLTNAPAYIETVGAERVTYPFHEALTYLVRASWGNGFFRVQYIEGGVGGNTIYDFGKGYDREYTPFPFNAFIGSPFKAGDRGEPSSLDGMIARQLWISPNPRPAFANK